MTTDIFKDITLGLKYESLSAEDEKEVRMLILLEARDVQINVS